MNPELQRLQNILKQLGYLRGSFVPGELDGVTEQAIRRFQLIHQLEPNGQPDDSTQQRILQAFDSREFAVFGYVVDSDGPVPDVRVMVQDRDLGPPPWQQLGVAASLRDGIFVIVYKADQFAAGDPIASDGMPVPDLIFSLGVPDPGMLGFSVLRMPEEQPLSPDDLMLGLQARRVEEVRIVVEMKRRRNLAGASEYEKLLNAFRAVWPDRSPGSLDESRLREISFAARELDEGFSKIEALAHAFLWPSQVFHADLRPEIFYGLARSRKQLTTVEKVATAGAEDLKSALFEAMDNHIIPQLPDEQIRSAIQLILKNGPAVAAAHRAVEGLPTFAERLAAAVPESTEQTVLLQTFAQSSGDVRLFWRQLRAKPAFAAPGKVERAQFALQLDAVTQSHLPLMNVLQSEHGLKSARELLEFGEEKLRETLSRADVGIPDDVRGSTLSDRLDNYVATIMGAVQLALPTETVALTLQSMPPDAVGGDSVRDAINKFFTIATSQEAREAGTHFDIRNANLDDYFLKHADDAFAGVSAADRERAQTHIARAKRLFHVSTDPKAFGALMMSGFMSARDIAFVPQQAFVEQFQGFIGPQQAMMAHNNALTIAASSIQLYVSINDVLRGANPDAVNVGDPDGLHDMVAKHIPNWNDLFGSPELCACAHCRSVYSPAAYLVDLLHFLERSGSNADGLTPLDILIGKAGPGVNVVGRRPDLAHLKLTCENTNTAIPYVDLVNEVLENLALSWATAAEKDGRIVADRNSIEAHDTGTTTTPELKASPQYLLTEVYHTPDAAGARERLDRVAWPLSLPYDESLEAARVYLKYLGVSVADLMEQFAKFGEATPYLAESLHISPNEFAIVAAVKLDGTVSAFGVEDLYGFTPELLPQLDATAKGPYVAALKQKLNTGGAGLALATDLELETFDAPTMAAVNALQAANGLPATGKVALAEWRILKGVNPDIAGLLLPNVRELLRRTGITYEELVNVCEMRFLNTDRAVFDIIQQLRLTHADLKTWIAAGLPADPGPTINAALGAAGVSQAAFVAWANDHLNGPGWDRVKTSLVLESPTDDPCNLDRTRLRHWDADKPDLTSAEWIRLNRLIRLWRKLGWPLDDLDCVLVAFGVTDITSDVVRQLALVQRAQADLDVTLDEVAMLWAPPDLSLESAFFQRRFLSRAALRNDAAFAPDWKGEVLTNAKISEHVAALLSGLRITADHLDAIRTEALPAANDDLTLENLGKMARYVIVARALGIPVPDFVALRQLSGMNPFTKPATPWPLQVFVKLMLLVQASDLSVPQLDYLFRGGPEHPLAAAADQISNTLREIEQGLARIATEYEIKDDQRGEITRTRLSTVYSDVNLVNGFAQIIDGSALYATPLPALPPGLLWPLAFGHRFAFDSDAKALVVRGALTEAERLALRGLSALAPFTTAIDALAAAPRSALAALLAAKAAVPITIPAAEANLIDTSSFDVQGEIDPAAVAMKFNFVLTSISPTLHEAARRSFIKQELAEALSVDSDVLARLIEQNADGRILLHSIGTPSKPMLQDFVEPITMANAGRAWLRLHKTAMLLGTFKPTEAEVGFLTGRIFNFDQLPDVVPATYDPAAFLSYGHLARYIQLKHSLPAAATPLAAVFAAADLSSAVDRLAEITGQAKERLTFLMGPQGFGLAVADFRDVEKLVLLLSSLKMIERLGIAPAQAFGWARQPINAAVADDVKRAARALVDETAWLAVAKKLNDPLREGRRDSLIAYVLPRLRVENSEQLYERLLIDVNMGACMMTSRVKQAAASVQLFIQQILLNLVPEAPPTTIDREQWKWMERYRVWEANRKVFLYPENWIEPALRDNKTPFFTELESELLQNDVTDTNVEKALLGYLEKLNEVAKLRMCGMFVQSDFEPQEKLKQVVHLFGRTLNIPYGYYYRRYVIDANDVSTWTPWEKVPVDVRGDQVAPVVFNRRLYLFWYTNNIKVEDPPMNTTKPSTPQTYDEIQVAWSEYVNGKWSPKFVGNPEEALRLSLAVTFSKRRFEANVSGERLSVAYVYPDVRGISYKPGFDINGRPTPARSVTEYMGKAEGAFEFDNCHGTLTLDHTGWTQSSINGYGIRNASIQPLGNGVPDSLATLTQNTGGGRITEEHMHHLGGDYFTYEDSSRTYFGHVEPKWGGPIDHLGDPPSVGLDLGKFGEILNRPYEVQRDLGRPYFSSVMQTAAAKANPWIGSTAALSSINLKVSQPPTMRVMSVPLGNGASVSYDPAAALISDYSVYARSSQASVRYDILYHPFTCEFIASLRRFGVPGLLNLDNQQLGLIDTFERRYVPNTAVVTKPYPVEFVDFGRVGTTATYKSTAYSIYNWEIFFHVPMLLATRLSENQRFEEARRWFHYVFDPTDGVGGYWKVLPFRTTPKERLDQLLTSLNAGDSDAARQVAEWRDHPFQPHLIARMRLIAYQKHVVMKYIDNLLVWADQLFRQDTIETVNEAAQLYVLCAKLLGPKPQVIPSRGEAAPATFAELRGKLDTFSNAMVSFENKFPSYSASSPSSSKDAAGLLGISRSFYFCIPQNDKLLGYWDTVADRLFKIRHCMNMEGVVRELPLFERQLDPALLVRAASQGIDISSVLNDINSPAPFYRFTHMMQKAVEMCNELKTLGTQFLTTLERRDAEHLALLRQQHESNIFNMVRLVREKQIEDAEAAIDVLKKQRAAAVEKYQHFQGLLGAEAGVAPQEGAEIQRASARHKPSAAGGAHLIDEETRELDSAHSARDWGVRSGSTETLGSALHYIPNFDILTAPWGAGGKISMPFGGKHIGPATNAIARYQKSLGEQDEYDASHLRRMGEHTRREQQWMLESNQAAGEIMHIDKQSLALTIKLEIAKQELRNHDKQIANAAVVEEYLRSKYTNEELYMWIQAQTSALFFRSYQTVYDWAKQTERSFQYDLGLTYSDFIRFGSWDSLRKGLLCGEQLALQLRQLDRAWHDRNKREYEITRHVSLVQLDPIAFVRLKQTGSCEFDVPEVLFDLDFPGHYFRRLRTVSLSIPCVAGPFTSISATLTLLHHRIRTDSRSTVPYPEKPGEEETRFLRDFVPTQSVAVSNANNDSGLFDLNFRDERYLPFEGAGAISRWRLQLPQRDPDHPETSFAQFDYETVTDVVLHLKYTAREGGDALGEKVTEALKRTLNQLNEISGKQGLVRLFSLRHEFPNEWRRTRQPGEPLSIEIPKNRFPFFVQARKVTVQAAFHARHPDDLAAVTDPQFVPAKNLWKLTVNPPVDEADMLILFVYTIG